MGQHVSSTEFIWTYDEQPHSDRRKIILQKHPEIKQLFGTDPSLKYVVTACVLMQTVACYLLKDSSWQLVLAQAYFFGGLVNHALTLAIHDISHNTAFGSQHPIRNRWFGMFANLPIGIPISISFKKYHVEHHRYLSEEGLDTDLPTEFEAKLFTTPFRKFFWIAFQPFFYGLRPLIVYKKMPCDLELVNAVVQIIYDLLILYFCGLSSLLYLIGGTLLVMVADAFSAIITLIVQGPHPSTAHFISEHYAFSGNQETYSYYGVWNVVLYNVGYHNEHHDFPYVPGRHLPKLRQIASEFYDHLYSHESWSQVFWQFVFSPGMGPYKRLKRLPSTKQQLYCVNPLWNNLKVLAGSLMPQFHGRSSQTVQRVKSD